VKVTSAKEIIITLELNCFEACWLKSTLQNPLNFEDETPEDADMRRMFFDAINSELKKRD